MFDSGFATLFRAVDRIRNQLQHADEELRRYLAEELACLQRLGEQCIDQWMALDEQILELFDTFELHTPVASSVVQTVHASAPASQVSSTKQVTQPFHLSSRSTVFPGDVENHSSMDWSSFAFDYSDKTAVAFRRGMAFYDLLMFDEAAKFLSQALEQWDEPVARIYLAAAHAAQNRTAEAMVELHAVRQRSMDKLILSAADEIEAHIHLQGGAIEKAIRCFTDILRRRPDFEDVWFNLGVCYVKRGDLLAAHQALAKTLELQPRDVEAAHVLALVYRSLGQTEYAIELCRHMLRLVPRHVGLLATYAELLSYTGNADKGISILRRACELQPDNDALWQQMVWTYLRKEGYEEAFATLKKWLSIRPNHAPALMHLGIALMMKGELEQAERILTAQLGEKVDKAILWLALGQISAAKGNLNEAYTRLSRCVQDPRPAIKRLALYYYGKALYEAGSYTDAEKYLKAAAVLGEGNSAIYFTLARVSEKLGRPLEAEKLFQRAQACMMRKATS